MRNYGCRILLQHDQARRFFEEAMHPDMEELRRRDAYLARLDEECPIRMEGTDVVMEIPDVDIVALMGGGSAAATTSKPCAQAKQERFVLELPDVTALAYLEYSYITIEDATYAKYCKSILQKFARKKNVYKPKAVLNIAV